MRGRAARVRRGTRARAARGRSVVAGRGRRPIDEPTVVRTAYLLAAAGIAAAAAAAFAARRGKDPLGPRPSGEFGDTTLPLLVAMGAYVFAIVSFPQAADFFGLSISGRLVAFSLMNLVFALALFGSARRAAPRTTISVARQVIAGIVGGLATFGWVAIAGFLFQEAYDALGVPLPEQDVVRHARDATGFDAVGAFVAAVVLAPFAEEVFWRGIALPAALRFASPRNALLLQAVAFGGIHVVQAPLVAWPLAIPLALVGWLAGWLYLRTASLGAAVLLHAVFNALNLVFLRATA